MVQKTHVIEKQTLMRRKCSGSLVVNLFATSKLKQGPLTMPESESKGCPVTPDLHGTPAPLIATEIPATLFPVT